jgi:hypothetical protein
MAAKDKAFQNYLNAERAQLNDQAEAMDQRLADQVTQWKASHADAKVVVTGRNFDLTDEPASSLQNLQSILSVIAKAVFTGGQVTPGTTVDKAAQQDIETTLSSAGTQLAAAQLLITGEAFDVLGNIIYEFGSSTSTAFDNSIRSHALGLGFQLFVGVDGQTFAPPSPFDNETVYGFVYSYQVYLFLNQLRQETDQTIAAGLAKQVADFETTMRTRPRPDDPRARQAHDSLMAWYAQHIAAAKTQLEALGHR